MGNLIVFSDLIVFSGAALGVLIMIGMVYDFVSDVGAVPNNKAERQWTLREKVIFGFMCAWVAAFSIFIPLVSG